MVPLILKKEQEILSQNTIESLILHRYNELSLDGFNPDIYNHDTYYAACGFLGKSVYFVLRSIFPRLQFENPHFKIGGTNSKVDLMLVQEGIDIEIKMIKAKNQDEKEFIKQLKIDINDYAAWNELKHLLVFVYDPFNKTSNKNNFYDLNGHKSINGTEFDVTVFVSN